MQAWSAAAVCHRVLKNDCLQRQPWRTAWDAPACQAGSCCSLAQSTLRTQQPSRQPLLRSRPCFWATSGKLRSGDISLLIPLFPVQSMKGRECRELCTRPCGTCCRLMCHNFTWLKRSCTSRQRQGQCRRHTSPEASGTVVPTVLSST